MDKRRDDRDAKKSDDEATEDPWEAQKDGSDQQAAELQVGQEDELRDTSRFEPDPKGKESAGRDRKDDREESEDHLPEP